MKRKNPHEENKSERLACSCFFGCSRIHRYCRYRFSTLLVFVSSAELRLLSRPSWTTAKMRLLSHYRFDREHHRGTLRWLQLRFSTTRSPSDFLTLRWPHIHFEYRRVFIGFLQLPRRPGDTWLYSTREIRSPLGFFKNWIHRRSEEELFGGRIEVEMATTRRREIYLEYFFV